MLRFSLSLLFFSVLTLNSHAQSKSFATEIKDLKTFDAMADRPAGVVQKGKVIKFIIDNRKYPSTPQIYYINGLYCEGKQCPVDWVKLHRTWAEKNIKGFNLDEKQFNENTYYSKTIKERQFIAGRVETFELNGKIIFGAWFVEIDQINEEMIQYALEQVKRTFKVSDYPLDFVAFSSHQSVKTISPWLSENNFNVHQIGELMGDQTYMPMNAGEAWGYLRFDPKDSTDLEADDIAVFKELPLDLAVVAGTVTTSFQDVASHVNLKSKERKTPNMVIRDEVEIAKIKAMDGQPVHMVVRADGYVFEPTTREMIQKKLDEKINKPWKAPGVDLAGSISHYDEMCPKDPRVCISYGDRYGGKGSRLGFLANSQVIGINSVEQKKSGYRLTPLGFAIPTNFYKKFIDYNKARSPEFEAALDKLIQVEMGLDKAVPFTKDERKEQVQLVKNLFLQMKFPPGMYAEINAAVQKLKADVAKQYPGEDLNKLKIRSSANVEDIENFDGAGLHDSFSARIKKSAANDPDGPCTIAQSTEDAETKTDVEPKTIACAIKATFASLWNFRALRERTFHRFDHRQAYMGLSVLPAYGFRSVPQELKVAANSVLITRVLNTAKVYGYQISSQRGDNLVTNPQPGTIAELTNMTFQIKHADEAAMTVFRYATPVAGQPALTEPILDPKTMQRMVTIARTIEEAYCKANPNYFVVDGKPIPCNLVSNSQRKPKSLDMEIKILSNGEILFKQSREFSGR